MVEYKIGVGTHMFALKICSIQHARSYDKIHQPKEYKTGALGRLIGELQVLFYFGIQYLYKHIVYLFFSHVFFFFFFFRF